MILNTQKTDHNDKRLLQIDEDGIEVDEDVISYAVLSVTITKDEIGNYVYGLNMITPGVDDDENLSSEELVEAKAAESFLQRALKLVMNEVEGMSNEEKKQKERAN